MGKPFARANKGYVGMRMSVRAAEAYEDGEMPASKWTKTAMLAAISAHLDDERRVPTENSARMRKADLFFLFFRLSSWHHTGGYYNETDFFALDAEEVDAASREMTAREEAEADAAERASRAAEAAEERERRESLRAERAAEAAFERERGYKMYSPAHAIAVGVPCTVRTTKRGARMHGFDLGGRTIEYDERQMHGRRHDIEAHMRGLGF